MVCQPPMTLSLLVILIIAMLGLTQLKLSCSHCECYQHIFRALIHFVGVRIYSTLISTQAQLLYYPSAFNLSNQLSPYGYERLCLLTLNKNLSFLTQHLPRILLKIGNISYLKQFILLRINICFIVPSNSANVENDYTKQLLISIRTQLQRTFVRAYPRFLAS